MSEQSEESAGSTRKRALAVVAVIALVLAVVVGLALTSGEDETSEQAGSGGAESGESSANSEPGAEPTDEPLEDAPSPGQPNEGEADGAGGGEGDGDEAVDSPDRVARPLRVSIDETAEPRPDLQIAITRVEQVRSRAELPGETSRPALRVTVRAENLGDEPLPIGNALTNLYYGPDRDAATLVLRPGGRPFPPAVAPGESVSSVVVYNVPPRARGQVVLEVSLDTEIRRVEFSGDCRDGC